MASETLTKEQVRVVIIALDVALSALTRARRALGRNGGEQRTEFPTTHDLTEVSDAIERVQVALQDVRKTEPPPKVMQHGGGRYSAIMNRGSLYRETGR